MTAFKGFPEGKVRFTPIPSPFFSELLTEIDHLGELKVTLYALWWMSQMEGIFKYLRRADFAGDERFMAGMGRTALDAAAALDDSLERAVLRGTLLAALIQLDDREESFYFINSPKGRAAIDAIRQGKWRPSGDPRMPVELSSERPNIFRLYEANIGPLTPMIAETLRDAEATYPELWVEEALRIAVENNKRNWRYVDAILRRWREEGRNEQNRGDSEKDRRRYVEGEFSDFIEH
ncbi:MAG: DnaD domain protein [Chloroflexota bacterium]|nr:MAG: DnaD domain protein [Chloroflexota bacterium]